MLRRATMLYVVKAFVLMISMFSFCNTIPCEFFPHIPHGELQLEDIELPVLSGVAIRFHCDHGYRPDALPSLVSCRNGTWQISTDMCRPVSCGFPGSIENAIEVGNVYTFPHNVTYVCKEGYRIKGSAIIFCTPSQNWSPSTKPVCEAIVCPLLLVNNGKVVMSNDRKYKSTATYDCQRYFHLEGNAVRYCQEDATWNGTASSCVATTCPNPGPLAHGRIIPNKLEYNAGDVVIFKCSHVHPGEEMYLQHASKCLESGTWQKPPPQCPEPTTTAPTITTIETTMSVTSTVTESTESIKESSSCHDPGEIRNGNRTITDLKPNSNVTYSCEPGYELRGEGTLICLSNGKWNLDKLPICVKPIPISIIIAIVCGIVTIISLGVAGFFIYRWRENKIRGYGKKSKALTSDAADLEEITGLDKGKKPIPVTVL